MHKLNQGHKEVRTHLESLAEPLVEFSVSFLFLLSLRFFFLIKCKNDVRVYIKYI